ncbi:MAG: sulfurtransferase [Gemmatimonadota bacterium]
MESSPAPSAPTLVSVNWLMAHAQDAGVVVLDCSYYLPASGRDADEEYLAAHVPGAVRFDIDAASDPDADLPHMLPSPGQFAEIAERLGIRPDDWVICYDGSGSNLSAARGWWMFRVFGHARVSVLDGGFGAWARDTRPVQRGAVRRLPTGYRLPTVDARLVYDRAMVERIVAGTDATQLGDCRSVARFGGEEDEPRAGVRRGHIEGSRNIPFGEFTDPATRRFKSPDALRALFSEHGLDVSRPIVASCGSGVTACTMALALEVIRDDDPAGVGPPVAVYDGSWAEWGRS